MRDNVSKLIAEMLSEIVKINRNGSLNNLRRVFEKMTFSSFCEKRAAEDLMGYAHLSCFNFNYREAAGAMNYFEKSGNEKMFEEVLRVCDFYGNLENSEFRDDFVFTQREIYEKFMRYAKKEGIRVLKMFQAGIHDIRRCSYVYLCQDKDGIIKIYKELLDYNKEHATNIFSREDKIYECLPFAEFLPKYYGKIDIDYGLSFIKLSFCRGRTLSDYLTKRNLFSVDEVAYIVLKIIEKIKWLHEHNVLYLDLKPQNILFDGKDIFIFDFGISRILKLEEKEVDVFLADPKYGAPECGTRLKSSYASDVFQLGILIHQMLTGEHPFLLENSLLEGDEYRESEILKYFWPNICRSYAHDLARKFYDKRFVVIKKMLEKNSEERFSLSEAAEILSQSRVQIQSVNLRKNIFLKRIKEKNAVLFPARMGLPHIGHINFMEKILDAGFYLNISLQRSFTITERDPIPKWIVMKMVARSLFDKGFSEEDFKFIFTPFYETEEKMKMHFAIMPGIENVLYIVSGNPSVRELFKNFEILDQKSFFAVQGEDWENLSWGETIRKSVKENDYPSFKSLAASGVEKIQTFEEIKKTYGNPPIEFVPGEIKFVLCGADEESMITSGKIFKHFSPEENIIFYLIKQRGFDARIVDFYGKYTAILLNQRIKHLRYLKTEFDGANETIFYQLF